LKGNPARQDGWMSEAGSKLNFNDGSTAVCNLTQQVYILENNRVVKKDNPG
jgi:hypothetical protein